MTNLAMIWILPLLGSILCENNTSTNSSDPNKDMYVIHAMVYQVGILTNKTDDKAPNTTMGNQEALTFYHTNGSNIDLSGIPPPLLTNVTAQSMVQVAPKTMGDSGEKPQISWSALKDLASLPKTSGGIQSTSGESGGLRFAKRDIFRDYVPNMIGGIDNIDFSEASVNKRSASDPSDGQLIREASNDQATVKVVKGAAVVPPGAGVQSIAIPPLLSLNNNLSDIPVPIPNTSVVHYAKINTVVRKP